MKDIEIQDRITNEIEKAINAIEKKNPSISGCYMHAHKCTFDMLCPEIAEQECAKWRAKQPVRFPTHWPKPSCREDYCDFCDMMNYIALDEKGRIMYTVRSDGNKLLHYFNRKK